MKPVDQSNLFFSLFLLSIFLLLSPKLSKNLKNSSQICPRAVISFGGVLFCLKSNLEPSGAKGCFQERNMSALYGPKRKDFYPKSSRGFLTKSYFRPEKITFWVKRFMQFFSSKIFIVLVVPSLLMLHSNIPKMLQKS
jgi:hypothetical protein